MNDENGKRAYRQMEFVGDEIVKKHSQSYDGDLQIIEPKNNNEWLDARLAGYTARELCKRGMSYKQQKQAAEELRSEQQSKRQAG